jgi:predicted anti-sigma-YlaC factor YlaD
VFGRENLIGMLLLLFCAVTAVIMIVAIITGETPTVPSAMRVPITVIGIAAVLVVLWQRFSGRFRRK